MDTIEAGIIQHKLYAEYWIAMATTGAAKERQMYKSVGTMGYTELTDEEKVNEALNTALGHIRIIGEMAEKGLRSI